MSAVGHDVRQKFIKSQSVCENGNNVRSLYNLCKCTNLTVSKLTHSVLLNATHFTASVINNKKEQMNTHTHTHKIKRRRVVR